MYLSQLFLSQLDKDCSLTSVMNALTICDKELSNRSEAEKFAICNQDGFHVLSPFEYELLDLWDVYKEFDSLVTEQQKKLHILTLIRKTKNNLKIFPHNTKN